MTSFPEGNPGMKSGRQIGIGIALLLLIGCGGSDDESKEVANGAMLRSGDQEIVNPPPAAGGVLIAENSDKPESKELSAPLGQARPVKKEESKIAREPSRPKPKVETAQPVKVSVPEKSEAPLPVPASVKKPDVV
ncbi:MAG: hypothetical protein ACWGQW_13895, partial [bacterium]